MSTQRLHRNPEWPTDDEFLSVNQAVEVACGLYPKVEQSLAWALIWEESKYDPLALGRRGEVGLGQLTPATARCAR
jgi:soluble lytic murein transglycosylase-like protein